MAEATGGVRREDAGRAPRTWGERLKYIGPGFVVAATGVGAGDMVSSLSAGTNFGTVLIWAIVIGALLKYVLTEGLGRWYMASGTTILEGWRSLGLWASLYFVIYLLIVTFVFGAAVVSASALATTAMFPGVMPLWAWAVLHGIFGFVVIGIGRYRLFERIMEFFVGLMFVTVVGLAIMLTPNLGELALGIVVPRIPEGSVLYALAIIGGVGGTFTLASYPYWVRERGWSRPSWIPMMRLDLSVGYLFTALFMVSMLVIGAELLFARGEGISGEEGLVALSDPIGERFGALASWFFLIGFWAAATSSILGAWNGAAYLFADSVRTILRVPDERAEEYLSETGLWFRLMLVWITFPPMLLLSFGQPVLLVVIYAALGAFFMPFMAFTLLWLLNSRRVPPEYRNGWLSNLLLAAAILLFVVVGVQEVAGAL
ncbi:Divalent metal cation transporter MntH [Rubrobacter xylanophilus DSM 9941]|uniref:Nramp family divalent metal transporter n=1 Tax=Rubrobacter xylanophilus TaxID=49319 RepID=UPI001C64311B|nr:Nramp family divalent metal transporter [Rubrobacter xylanophilus]QYJ16524.1 Divalent metal cation transporter MntH [Rubrobacter xylanophilus DSM 9941]